MGDGVSGFDNNNKPIRQNRFGDKNGRHKVSVSGGKVIYEIDSDDIYIDSITIDDNSRQKGIGTALLNGVKKISNRTGKPIELFASPIEGDMSTKQLVNWYASRGFTIKTNYGAMGARMRYEPQKRKSKK